MLRQHFPCAGHSPSLRSRVHRQQMSFSLFIISPFQIIFCEKADA
ncbi:hypothetical protein CLOSTMETH_03553 [[Clostridium] methylpentosum DSM 5476]|uniref:Uncharacterized protein n=1 Tax=[Clostridium] methylpentosum DSM 5476 TaxID=537013 RepID=C0EI58_9FIRM|nr:hypothetical protein CLOSTMETH_03553 [[Clostridium] methylpentosum DSM 5476]